MMTFPVARRGKMAYKYAAYTKDKQIIRGTLEVSSESLAEAALYRAGYDMILSLEERAPGLSVEKLLPTWFGVKPQEVIEFSGQLATLLGSGVALPVALHLLRGQSQGKALHRIISGLVEAVQGGQPLSQGLAAYPQAFPDTYRQVIRASEQAGNLDVGLRRAAGYLEKRLAAVQKIRRAMLYPVFVILVAAGVAVLLFNVALPPLVQLFTSLDAELPWMTRLLIRVMGFITNNGGAILAFIGVTVFGGLGLLRLETVCTTRDGLLLKLPVFGVLTIERSMQQVCRTAAMLLGAGLRLPLIFDIVIKTERNRVIGEALRQVRDRLVQGEGLSRPMSENPVFPALIAEMVAVGEKTGTMDTTLDTLADLYERKVDRRVDILVSMIEPVMTLVIGAVVILIALSMIMPMYSILRSM